MGILSKADVNGGHRVDGHVINVSNDVVWIRAASHQEHGIKWLRANEDVRVGHEVSAFVSSDGTAHQIRNRTTGRVLSTFTESMSETYSWIGPLGAFGSQIVWLSLVPGFNYLAAFFVGIALLVQDFRLFLKAGALLALLTLPLINNPAILGRGSDIIGFAILAFAPTIAIYYAGKVVLTERLREHNSAVQQIEAAMA